ELDRYAGLAEAGPAWTFGDRFGATLSVAAGAVTVVRRADGAMSRGDVVAPALGAGAGLSVRVGGRFDVGVNGQYLGQWIRRDGARKAFRPPGVDLGVAYRF